MRKALVVAVVGLVFLTGLGVAVAQLGGNNFGAVELTEVPTEPTTTVTAPTTQPETTAPEELSTTGPVRKSTPAVTSSTKPATLPAPVTQPPGSAPGFAPGYPPPSFVVPTQPVYPYEPPPDPYTPDSKVVQPRPGMENLHKTGWDRVEVLGSNRVRVHFVSGVEPCTVLDHVDVDYSADAIVITLFEGNDPASREMACIMIAQYKAVDVNLAEPINGRKFVDGAE
ncbi:MAG: hypothetical protein WD627_11330 [Actinomycetota bacterium]